MSIFARFRWRNAQAVFMQRMDHAAKCERARRLRAIARHCPGSTPFVSRMILNGADFNEIAVWLDETERLGGCG